MERTKSNMAAEMRDERTNEVTRQIPLPAGLTPDEVVAHVEKWKGTRERLAQVVEYNW